MKKRCIPLHVLISEEAREKLEKYRMGMRIPTRYGERAGMLGEALSEILEKLEVKE